MSNPQCNICLKYFSSKQALNKHLNKKKRCEKIKPTESKSDSPKENNYNLINQDEIKQLNVDNELISLTDEQQLIINSKSDLNIRIIAGAGCAKTTTLLYRIKFLIQNNIDSKNIILTTFTKDASLDMKNKLNQLIPNCKLIIGTIDSISKRFYEKYFKNNDKTCYVGEFKVKFYNFLCSNSPELKEFIKNIKYIFVDEYQDINYHYFNIINQLYKLGVIITVVGDDSQNIYTWNGSNIKYILEFKQNFSNSESYFLTNNYRSTPEIIDIANESISKNENQIYKIIRPNINSIGKKPTVSYYYSWDKEYFTIRSQIMRYFELGIPLHEICILCRNCSDNGPLYFFETNLSKDKISSILLEGNKDVRSSIKPNHICLSTIHKSKGLEWSVVFILGCDDKYFPSKKDLLSIEEDRRLFYVGITRAKYYLHLSLSSKNDPCITRFITELNPKLFNFINTYHIKKKFSSNDKVYEELTVTKLIENLKTEHYIDLREKNIIPQLEWNEKQLYSENKYQDFIIQNDLFSDFGIFIDNLLTRQIGDIDIKSNGKKDTNANKVIAKIVLKSYQYNIYKQYKNNFILNSKYLNMVNYESIIKILENKENLDYFQSDFVKVIDRNHYSTILEIINLLSKNSKKFKLPIEDIPIFSENLLPVDFIKEMEDSYYKYTNNQKWDSIIPEIYRVSRSSNILKGRSRLLYTPISDNQIYNYLDLFKSMETKYINNFCFNKKNICKPILFYKGIIGEIDCITDDIIIDYKVSYQKNVQIEHIVQLLVYTVICQKNNYQINKIRIFNPIKGILSTSDISNYENGEKLINYLLNVRDEKILHEKKISRFNNYENVINIDTSGC